MRHHYCLNVVALRDFGKLTEEGFEFCGMIQFDGGPKLAYEWDRQSI